MWLSLASVSTSILQAETQVASGTRASTILPETVVGFAELPDVDSMLEKVLDHPLRPRIESMPAFQELMKSEGLVKLKQGIAAFEASMEQAWPDALRSLTDGGVSIALEASERGIVVLINSSDKEKLARLRDFLLAMRSMQRGKFSPAKQTDYRGFTAYALDDEVKLAVVDNWMMFTNKSMLGKSIIDRYLDRTNDSLEKSKMFGLAVGAIKPTDGEKTESCAFGFVDVQTIRNAGIAKAIYNENVENLVAVLVLGGILAWDSRKDRQPYRFTRWRLKA